MIILEFSPIFILGLNVNSNILKSTLPDFSFQQLIQFDYSLKMGAYFSEWVHFLFLENSEKSVKIIAFENS